MLPRLDVLTIDPDYRTKAHDGHSSDAGARCFRCGRLVKKPHHVIRVDGDGNMSAAGDRVGTYPYLIGPECSRYVPEGYLHGL